MAAVQDEDWQALRSLLRQRHLLPEERAALRRVLAVHGQLGSLLRMPALTPHTPIPAVPAGLVRRGEP